MNPERILWTRVLLQAIWDFAGIRLNAPPRDIPRLQRSARAWICSRDESQGSFIWTCNSLSLDPETVRSRVLTKTKAELTATIESQIRECEDSAQGDQNSRRISERTPIRRPAIEAVKSRQPFELEGTAGPR